MYPNKDPALEAFLEEIIGIADKDYQRRVWIGGEGPECDDFDEAVCRYSNAADTVFEEYKECGISNIQLALIKKFHQEFKKFWKQNDLPQLFIDTPEWTKITTMAKEVLRAFDYHKSKILKIKLTKSEYNYLCKVAFMQKKHREALLSAPQISDVHFINVSEDQAKEIRDLCGEQLQITGFDEKYGLTPEGEILESLIEKLFIA